MSGRRLCTSLILLAGATVLVAALLRLKLRFSAPVGEVQTTVDTSSPMTLALPEILTYAIGYALALLLSVAAFALVHWHWATPSTSLAIVFVLGLAQIIVHFRCFLHVTLHGPARDDLQLILFSTLIVLLMVGGTLVILFNLRMRMM